MILKKRRRGAMEILEVLIAVLMIVAIFALVVMMNMRFNSTIDTYMPFRMAVLVANRLSSSPELTVTPASAGLTSTPISTLDCARGVVCGGFCYKNIGDESFTCPNNKIWDNPNGLPLKIEALYPEYIPLNKDFEIILSVQNKGTSELSFKVKHVLFQQYSGVSTSGDKLLNDVYDTAIAANTKISVKIPLNSGNIETMSGTISIVIENVDGLTLGPIIIYDKQVEADCNGKKYNKNRALCINNALYPVGTDRCLPNSDCISIGAGACIENKCIGTSIGYLPNKQYSVGVLPIFIVDDDSKYNAMLPTGLASLKEITDKATAWFVSEKKYWKAESNPFDITYSQIKECRLTKSQYLDTLKNTPPSGDSGKQFYKNLIERCVISPQTFSVIAFHEFWDETLLDQSISNELIRLGVPAVDGLNYRNSFIFFRLDYSTFIHELLHSFGEPDIYPQKGFDGANFQWRDCTLFRASWFDFEKYPHLCPLEAKIIGWVKGWENWWAASMGSSTPAAGESAHKNILSAAKLDNYVKNYNETMPPGSALLCFHWRASVKEPDTYRSWEFGHNPLSDVPAQLLSSITGLLGDAYKSISENPINIFRFAYPGTFTEAMLKELIDMAPSSYSLPVSVATDSAALSCFSAGGRCENWVPGVGNCYSWEDPTDKKDCDATGGPGPCAAGLFEKCCCVKHGFGYAGSVGATMPAMLEVSVWKSKSECRDATVIRKILDETKASVGG